MKNNLNVTSGVCRLEVRASQRETFTEFHLTATIDGDVPAALAAEDLFSQVAATLIEHRIQPMQEKLYGLVTVRDEVLGRRNAIYRARGLDRTMPVTWLQGTPLHGGAFVGLQIWGIASTSGDTSVTTVENDVTGRGRLWSGAGFRMLHLPAVRGTTPTGSVAHGHTAQAQQMFTNVGLGLTAHGFQYTNVTRTWIYVARLLDWYDDLNKVRTAHYKASGLGVPGGPAFPASTGIQCWSDREECLVDVLAMKSDTPGALVVDPIRCSPRQDQSFNYGSAFSRGMSFGIEGHRTVHISGTASINTAGVSTHIGDAESQSLETLMSIAAILEQQGGGLRNITSATLFCKDQNAWEAWTRVTYLLQLPTFPKVCVLADVCRHDLLVEMEAVAVI
jgi:enamine deaminase RidA (YjgF/YER057c/UK114 family)